MHGMVNETKVYCKLKGQARNLIFKYIGQSGSESVSM